MFFRLFSCIALFAVSVGYIASSVGDDKPPPSYAKQAEEKVDHIANTFKTAVTVMSLDLHGSFGTGNVIRTKDGRTFVITAAHVIEGAKLLSPDGKTTKFSTVKVSKEVRNEDGVLIDTVEVDAEVVRYSKYGPGGYDIAILRVKNDTVFTTGVRFAKRTPVVPGTGVHLVGTPFNKDDLAQSLYFGRVAKLGANPRSVSHHFRDIADITVIGGMSGGGLFLDATGEYMGMVTNSAFNRLCLYVPVRDIYDFGKKSGLAFLFFPGLPETSDEELAKGAVDVSDAPVADTPSLLKLVSPKIMPKVDD